jgi:hypothetical protein
MGFWKREDDLERELRARRPEPRRELVDDIARMVAGRPRSTGRRLRFGVAIALTAGMLAALGSFGSLSYAANGVSHAAKAAVHVVVPNKAATPDIAMSSASAQYLVTICFHGFTLEVDSHFARLVEALGGKPGACKPRGRGHGGIGAFKPSTKTVHMCFKGKNTVVAKSEQKSLKKLGFKAGFCKK